MAKQKFTSDQIALIHRTMMANASEDDVALFVATCERTGLDPFARQIMPSSRSVQKDGTWKTFWTWLVTIDGLRKIAVDSGEYEGQEGPWWCGPDGVWKEIWTDPKNPCFAAKVLVHRKGFRTGLSGIAKYASYVQRKRDGQVNNVWNSLGDHMTAKCAEALGLRRAFPNEMAGLYTVDEMAQAGFEAPSEKNETNGTAAQPPVKAAKPQNAEWSIEEQEEFHLLLERIESEFKRCGRDSLYNDDREKWNKRKNSDTAANVLPAMKEWIQKLSHVEAPAR